MTTNVRVLTPTDAADFRQLRLQGLEECPTAFGASWADEEKKPLAFFQQRLESTADRWVLGAFADERLIGIVGFVRDGGEKSRHKGFVWGMYVDPAHRRHGVGFSLLTELIARASAMEGLVRIRLSVVTTNTSALQLYERLGFERYGEEPQALCIEGTFHAEYHLSREITRFQR
jgi:ribosomal protein S18 acetylase RimI-like enzyme